MNKNTKKPPKKKKKANPDMWKEGYTDKQIAKFAKEFAKGLKY